MIAPAVVLAVAAALVAVLALATATGGPRTPPGEEGPSAARRPPVDAGSVPGAPDGWPRALVALARLGRRAGIPVGLGDAEARIAAAGLDDDLAPADVAAAKGGLALAAALAGAPLALDGGVGGLLAVAAAVTGAALLPDVVLGRRARHRAVLLEADLADVLELLRVASAAGLPTTRAMSEVGARHPGVLAREIGRCARTTALGVPRAVALARLHARCPLPAVAALVAAVNRADRHGAPLAPVLAALAADARADRARALADHAAKAAPKIQLVVALLLVPSVLLLVAAAMLPALGLA